MTGIQWNDSALAARLLEVPERSDKALRAIIALYAPRAEAAMKQGAPWTDRTSNARNGLFARPVSEKGKRYAVVLAHTVNYGIWLEVKQAGRFAAITPVQRDLAPQMMETASKLFDAIFGGS